MERGVLTLPESSKLASLNAAKASGLDTRKGSIEIGKDADLVLVDYVHKMATISSTIVHGNVSGQYQLKQPQFEIN
jgi:imidazolonepropionase-like amidohydrolase